MLALLASRCRRGGGCRRGRRAPPTSARASSVCLPVTGPWVVVPRRRAASTTSCAARSRGYIVAGTDARVADRDVDVSFRGEIGEPGRPGRDDRAAAVVFHARADAGGAPGRRASSRSSAASRPRAAAVAALTGGAPAGGMRADQGARPRSVVVKRLVSGRDRQGRRRLPRRDAARRLDPRLRLPHRGRAGPRRCSAP